MKLLSLLFFIFFNDAVWAESFIASYANVQEAQCSVQNESIHLNLKTQSLTGVIAGEGRVLDLSFEPLKGQSPDMKVEIMSNFLESGFDLLGGQVISADDTSFGTYAIVLDKDFKPSQEMTIVYVEAMTGWQLSKSMNCTFK